MKPGMQKIMSRSKDDFKRVIRTLACGHTSVEPNGGGCENSVYGLCKKCVKSPIESERVEAQEKLRLQASKLKGQAIGDLLAAFTAVMKLDDDGRTAVVCLIASAGNKS